MSTKIVWNDVDGYVELNAAGGLGYRIEGNNLIGKTESHAAFDVFQVSHDDIPHLNESDEDGERNYDGYYLTESGNAYLPI